MQKRRPGPVILALLLLLPAAAAAQQPDSIVPLDSIVVAAPRAVATPGGASAIVGSLRDLAVMPAPTLETTLRRMPLVQVRRNSRGEAQVGIRGSSERQVAVLLDGVPVSLGWDHRTDLSVVPVAAARSITLVRGLSSVLHGPNVLGGVVEVGVARGARTLLPPPPFEAALGAEHTGGYSASASAARYSSDGGREVLLRAGGGWRQDPGQIAAPGTPVALVDDGLRANSDVTQASGFLSGRYVGAAGRWLSASAFGLTGDRGVMSEAHVEEPRFWRYPLTRRVVAALSGGTGHHRTPLGVGDVEVSIGYDVNHAEIDAFTNGTYNELEEEEDADTRTLTLRLLADHTIGPRGELRTAATFADVRHDETLAAPGTATAVNDYRQRLWSVAGETAWRLPELFENRVSGARLSLGLTLDGANTPETGDKPPLGALQDWGGRAGMTALVGGNFLVHTNVSRRARFPALRELYSGALGRFQPNPDLRPEVLRAAEAGATVTVGALELQTVGFVQHMNDAIVRVSTSTGALQRINRDEIRSRGVELLARAAIGRAALAADVTLQRVRAISAGVEDFAEYQPAIMGGMQIEAPGWRGIRFTAAAEHTGTQYCVHPDRDALQRLDAFSTFDVFARRIFSLGSGALSSLQLSVSVQNALNGTAYDQCGLARPGRTLAFALSAF